MKKWVGASRSAQYHAWLCESSDSSGAEFSRLIKIIIIMTGILIIINIITIIIILPNPSSRQGYNTTTE